MKRALLYPVMLALACGLAVGQSEYKVLYNFGTNGPQDAGVPNAGLVYRNGEMYGTTQIGGSYHLGTVFALSQVYGNVVEALLYSFCTTGDFATCADGAQPNGALVSDGDGNLYGTTQLGGTGICSGTETCGTVFKLTRISKHAWQQTTIHSFTGLDGQLPLAGVVLDSAGNVYGTTVVGGLYDWGTVFQLTPEEDGTWTATTLHDFNPAVGDGGYPSASLTRDSFGNLYGTTKLGGGGGCQGYGCGTVFQLSPNPDGTWTETGIYGFGPNQAFPISGMTLSEAGKLYGTTAGYSGHGTVFSLVSIEGKWKENKFLFDQLNGEYPAAPVLVWRGALYGTTNFGGAHNEGVIFRLDKKGEAVLYNFCSLPPNCKDGNEPTLGGPLLPIGPDLYGTAEYGGIGLGVVFKLTP